MELHLQLKERHFPQQMSSARDCLFQMDYHSPLRKVNPSAIRPPLMNTNLPPLLQAMYNRDISISDADSATGRSSTPSSDSQNSGVDKHIFRPIKGVSIVVVGHFYIALFSAPV